MTTSETMFTVVVTIICLIVWRRLMRVARYYDLKEQRKQSMDERIW